MFFRILGPLMVRSESGVLEIGSGRHRKILVTLLLSANIPVSIDRLVDVLWGTDPPATAVEQVQNCAGSLRRLFSSTYATVGVTRKPSAYVLHVDEDQVDAHLFQKMVEDSRKLDSQGARSKSAKTLRRAIGLWYGNAFEDVASDALRGEAAWLEELRMNAMLRYGELEMAAGNHAQVIADLQNWTEENPYHEGLHALLVRALHDTGRTVDALDVCRRVKCRFKDELGLDPGEELRTLEQSIFASGRERVKAAGRHNRSQEHAVRLLHDASSMLVEAVRLLREIATREAD